MYSHKRKSSKVSSFEHPSSSEVKTHEAIASAEQCISNPYMQGENRESDRRPVPEPVLDPE